MVSFLGRPGHHPPILKDKPFVTEVPGADSTGILLLLVSIGAQEEGDDVSVKHLGGAWCQSKSLSPG